ncbi:hypothetical protein [Pseudonocardia sp. GCM10023141]|uniref:hypothetical protein n=1 Tax=Pseudonocardia sp. GCM10023141 TaxID=3252653 RepID=UPI00361F73A7
MSDTLLQLRWQGRFGNRLLQYAYGATYARRTGAEYWLPSEWEGTRLFAPQPHTVVPDEEIRRALAGPADDGPAGNDARMAVVRTRLPGAELVDVESVPQPYEGRGHDWCHGNGCAFNPAVYAGLSRQHLQSLCAFSDEVQSLRCYQRYSEMQGLYDVAHLRRDDIANPEYNRTHPQGYSVVAKESYLAAFEKFGFSPDEVLWVSDDHTGRWHVGRPVRYQAGWSYPVGSEYVPGIVFDWLDDFLKLYFARTIFRANSSFSWWAGLLSPTARVLSPVLDRRHIYGVDGMEEITVDFVDNNDAPWLTRDDRLQFDIGIGE